MRSPVTRAACSRTSASSSSSAALRRLRSASSRSCNRRSRMAPASRSPLARSLNSVTRDVHGAIGSPRASARAAVTAATWARTMRQRTRMPSAVPAPAVSIPTVTRSCSDCRVGWLTAEAGSPMAMIQPVSGERLHAENDGIPSRSVERTAPSSALAIALAKSGLGLPPTNFSSARVRATIVMRASMTATTPSTGAFCWRSTELKRMPGCARQARSEAALSRMTGTPIETKYWPARDRGRARRPPAASSATRSAPNRR